MFNVRAYEKKRVKKKLMYLTFDKLIVKRFHLFYCYTGQCYLNRQYLYALKIRQNYNSLFWDIKLTKPKIKNYVSSIKLDKIKSTVFCFKIV